jgi:hypothetical protein
MFGKQLHGNRAPAASLHIQVANIAVGLDLAGKRLRLNIFLGGIFGLQPGCTDVQLQAIAAVSSALGPIGIGFALQDLGGIDGNTGQTCATGAQHLALYDSRTMGSNLIMTSFWPLII